MRCCIGIRRDGICFFKPDDGGISFCGCPVDRLSRVGSSVGNRTGKQCIFAFEKFDRIKFRRIKNTVLFIVQC